MGRTLVLYGNLCSEGRARRRKWMHVILQRSLEIRKLNFRTSIIGVKLILSGIGSSVKRKSHISDQPAEAGTAVSIHVHRLVDCSTIIEDDSSFFLFLFLSKRNPNNLHVVLILLLVRICMPCVEPCMPCTGPQATLLCSDGRAGRMAASMLSSSS